MESTATAPRHVAEPAHDSIESAIAECGRRPRAGRIELTAALLRYWSALPRHGLDARLRWLDATRAAVRAGETTPRAFVVPALGDADENVVFGAAVEYVGAHPVSIERRRAAVEEAADWIRRSLALNRSAVFAALLSFGDAWINESLTGLRLILSRAEIESLCRKAAQHRSSATRAFLADWIELLDAATTPDVHARRCVAAALAEIGG